MKLAVIAPGPTCTQVEHYRGTSCGKEPAYREMEHHFSFGWGDWRYFCAEHFENRGAVARYCEIDSVRYERVSVVADCEAVL